MENLSKELSEVIRWIPEEERKSKYFIEYLDKIFNQMKELCH